MPIVGVKMVCELMRHGCMELPSKQETGMIKGTQIDIKGSCDNSLRKRSLVLQELLTGDLIQFRSSEEVGTEI